MKTLQVRKPGPMRIPSIAIGCYNCPCCSDCGGENQY
jgi:hypothetical protein